MGIKISDKALNRVALVLAGYGKRFLEGVYNKAFHTKAGQRLKDMPEAAKYSTELILYTLNALLAEQMDDNSPLMKLISEVIVDAPSEISKRMINGQAELADLENLFKTMAPGKQEDIIKRLILIAKQSNIGEAHAIAGIAEQDEQEKNSRKPIPIIPVTPFKTPKSVESPFSVWAQETTAKLHAKRDEIRRQRQERRKR